MEHNNKNNARLCHFLLHSVHGCTGGQQMPFSDCRGTIVPYIYIMIACAVLCPIGMGVAKSKQGVESCLVVHTTGTSPTTIRACLVEFLATSFVTVCTDSSIHYVLRSEQIRDSTKRRPAVTRRRLSGNVHLPTTRLCFLFCGFIIFSSHTQQQQPRLFS